MSDDNITLDAHEDDWAWRAKIRSNPKSHRLYRIAVFVVGLIVLIAGIIAIPFPGPGWLIVFLGLGIWASEFEKAQAVLDWVKGKVRAWEQWLRRQNVIVQGLFALATFALVLAIFWALFYFSGIPGFFPDAVKDWLHKVPGL
ncbi:TIGR02611 family protein [Dermacoccaceae bacterium W4C1]